MLLEAPEGILSDGGAYDREDRTDDFRGVWDMVYMLFYCMV